jgi:hypothetical protein
MAAALIGSSAVTAHTPEGPAWDGLVEIEVPRKGTRVWLMPDIDMSTYTSLRLEGAGIHFRPVKRSSGAAARSGRVTDYPISESNQERIRAMAREIFPEEIDKTTRFEIVDTNGPDTLILKGALIDVVSNVPPPTAGRSNTIVSVFGEATIVLEFIDSESGAVVARIVERRAVQPPGGQMRDANTVTAQAEARRTMRQWAIRIREALDQVDEIWDEMDSV